MRIFSNELSTDVWRTCIITGMFRIRYSNNIFLLKCIVTIETSEKSKKFGTEIKEKWYKRKSE